jgi:hypothetical protein
LIGALRAGAEGNEFPEYKLKAAFLYNFAKFVTWPSESFASTNAPLVIGVLGQSPFGDFLEETVRGKSVNGRPFKVRFFGRNDNFAECHILFVSNAERDRLPAIMEALQKRPVLTVGENEAFIKSGGMVNFVLRSQAVRFEMCIDSTAESKLVVSSKLSGVGTIVKRDAVKGRD